MNCKNCKQAFDVAEARKEMWGCSYCEQQVCCFCYSDHTDERHFDELFPGMRARLNKLKEEDKISSQSCMNST